MLATTLERTLTATGLSQVRAIRIEITAEVLNLMGITVRDGDAIEQSKTQLEKLPVLQDFNNVGWGIIYQDWDKPVGERGLSVSFCKDNSSLGQRLDILFTMQDGQLQTQINGEIQPQWTLTSKND